MSASGSSVAYECEDDEGIFEVDPATVAATATTGIPPQRYKGVCLANWVFNMPRRLEGKCKQNLLGGELAWWDVEGVWWPQDPVIKCVSANQCPPMPEPPEGETVKFETKTKTMTMTNVSRPTVHHCLTPPVLHF